MKKIIALITAITVIISILNISAYATSEPSAMTHQEYYVAQSDLIEKYCNGDITFTEWQERQAAVNTEFLEANKNLGDTAYATAVTISNQFSGTAQKISSTVEKWGDGARERISDWWNDVCGKNNVPTENTQTSTIDMHGYGACIEYIDSNINGHTLFRYCQYVILRDSSYFMKAPYVVYSYSSSKHEYSFSDVKTNSVTFNNSDYRSYIKFYGDIRYEDGTQAPTDDEFEYGTIKKFDEMPERDLEDLINAFDEVIEQNNPDLSSIEGLLSAIYARMGTLDSDNDNDLLASINANILALLEADKDKDDKEDNTNEELVKTLLEIRDSLKNGTLGTSPEAHGHEISGTVYNVIPLDKEWLDNMLHKRTNLKVNYQGSVYYLEDCGCLKLGDKYYTPNMNYDEYSADYYDIDDLPSFTFDSGYDFSNNADSEIQTYSMVRGGLPPVDDFLESGNSVIQPLIDKAVDEMSKAFIIGVPYDDIKKSISTFQSIVFNRREPKDVIISIKGQQVVILSAEFNSYLTGGSSSGSTSGNNFNYGDLLNGGNFHYPDNPYTPLSDDNDIMLLSEDTPVTSTPVLATYVKIARTFSTILIGFTWALNMRKKIVAMI